MNWSAIGAAAELLSAVGVLVTLLYLARQIRLNTKEVRDSAVQAIQEQNIAFLDSDLHTDIGYIYDRTFAGETTTPSEKAKLRIWGSSAQVPRSQPRRSASRCGAESWLGRRRRGDSTWRTASDGNGHR